MIQVVLEAPGQLAERNARAPEAGPGEALIHIEKIGICGSDFHAFAGKHPIYTYPRVLGHELSGVVVEIADNERGIRPGDRCAIEPYISCGRCRACLRGRNNCCEQIQVIGVHIDGGLQEFLAVPIRLLYKSDILSLDQLALVETLGIGAHAVGRSHLKPEEEVLIVGAGPIGIAVAQFASARGATVHIIERNEWRQRFIERMGFSASPDAGHRRADVVFDATGNADAMSASLELVATGGRLVYVGLTRDPIRIDDSLFHRREVTLLASRNSYNLFQRIIRQIEEGEIDTSPWITHRLALSDVVSRFRDLQGQPTLIKAIVDVCASRTGSLG